VISHFAVQNFRKVNVPPQKSGKKMKFYGVAIRLIWRFRRKKSRKEPGIFSNIKYFLYLCEQNHYGAPGSFAVMGIGEVT